MKLNLISLLFFISSLGFSQSFFWTAPFTKTKAVWNTHDVPLGLNQDSTWIAMANYNWARLGNDIFNRNTGNIGLGTSSPAAKLDIIGTARVKNGLTLGQASSVIGAMAFLNSSNSNNIVILSGVTTTSYSMVLPTAQGATGTVLSNNGSGTLSWAVPAASGVTSVATSYGLSGGTITSTGTLKVDTTTGTGGAKLATQYYVSTHSGTGTVTTVTAGSGLTGGPITTSGTLKADTSLLATKYFTSKATLYGYVAKTSTYSITASDYTINCTSGTFTVTLPTAIGASGKTYNIKNSGSGTITVATTSGQTIDGNATETLTQYNSMTVQSDGANWIII